MDFFLASADVVHIDRDAAEREPAEIVADAVYSRAPVAPGLIWRCAAASFEAASAGVFGDGARFVTGVSVWRSYADLRRYVAQAPRPAVAGVAHRGHVLWWVAPGERPRVADAVRRAEQLAVFGPGPAAFTVRSPAPPPRRAEPPPEAEPDAFGRAYGEELCAG